MMWYEIYFLIGLSYSLFIIVVNARLRSKYAKFAIHKSVPIRLFVAFMTAIFYPLLILAITIASLEDTLRKRALLEDLKNLTALINEKEESE